MMNPMRIFAGHASQDLAKQVADILLTELGNITVTKFSDGETRVEILESIRGHDVYIIQSTHTNVNEYIMELLIMVDAFRRSGAAKITAVIPYFGYSRQDRKTGFSRTPITASLIANLLNCSGVDLVITMDLHAQQIQGFFPNQIINITAKLLIVNDIENKYCNKGNDVMIVSPDVGGVGRAREIAKDIGDGKLELAIVDKRRPKANVSEVMNIIGDVAGKTCIMIDDMADTAGTLNKAAAALMANGAAQVVAYCTHPVLSGSAYNNINSSELTELVVTNTIPLDPTQTSSKIRVLNTAASFAQTINRLRVNSSVSQQFV
jgi:ribose-phosphate pyrophosphokinase